MSTGTRGHASKVDRTAATKQTTVEFVSKQADDQLVTGVVMSPYEVDRQGDYETPETIAQFAADFGDMYANGSADGGIMHAAWPSEWMALTNNGIVGKTFPDDAPIPDDIDTMEGCINWAEAETDVDDPAAFCQSYNVAEDIDNDVWAQTWRVTDDDLWSLIDDEIIQGFSIGARDVTWSDPMEQAELPEGVGVPDEFPDDAMVYELQDGVVREVSAVDTPAVPSAQILAKDDEKSLDQYLGDREGFIDEMLARGHDEAAAERVWDVMSRAVEVDGSGSPGSKSIYERIGKAVTNAVPGIKADDTPDDAAGAETQTRPDTAKRGPALAKEWGADAYWVRAGDDPMDGQEPGDLLGIAVDMPEGDVFIDWKRDAFPDPLDEPHISVYGSIDDLMTATSNTIEPAGSFMAETDDTEAARAAKEGRTLSRANRDSAMAAIDANLDLLEDAGVDHGMTRFTDRGSYAFDLSEHTARSWGGGGDGDDDDTDDEDDDSESESMTDTNDDGGDGSSKSGDGDGGDPFDDAPAWAKSLKDGIKANSEQIKEVADGGDTDGGDTDGGEKDAFDDAPEWASALKEQVEANAQAVESIGKQAGFSQQVQGNGNADKNGEGDEPTLANALRKGGVQ